MKADLPEWAGNPNEGTHYCAAVKTPGLALEGVENGEVVRTVPDFDAPKVLPMCGPDGVATLVPRDYPTYHLAPPLLIGTFGLSALGVRRMVKRW